MRSQSAPDRKGWVPHLGVLLVHGWGEGEEPEAQGQFLKEGKVGASPWYTPSRGVRRG